MPTPDSGPISMEDVQTETNLTPNMFNFYNASLGGGNGLGQYHNLNMGPGLNLTYKSAIFDPRSLGANGENLKLENFYNYDQGPDGRFDIDLLNSSTCDVNYEFFIGPTGLSSAPAPGPGSPFLSGTLTANGGTRNETDFDIDNAMTTANFADGVYNIYMTASSGPPPGPPPGPTITATGSASDTDNVGAGLFRVINTGAINFSFGGGPLPFLPIVQGNIGTGAGTGIFVNKRTTFSLTFN